MPKISIVMPSLNVGNYIKKCIDSVVNQTLEDIEIICVDAGSTDGTLEVLQQYQKKDSRIRIINSPVRSYGYQLNIGIENATGDYIGIVETDDYIASDMYEILYSYVGEYRPDYVKANAVQIYEVEDKIIEGSLLSPYLWDSQDAEGESVDVTPYNNPELFISDNFLWKGIYRADFLRSIRFRETPGAAFQDIDVLFRIISAAKTATYINKTLYYYRQDNGEASSYNPKSFMYTYEAYKYILNNCLYGLSAEWKKIAYKKLMQLTLNRFDEMVCSGTFWENIDGAITNIIEMVQAGFAEKIISGADFTLNQRIRMAIMFDDYKQLYKTDLFSIMAGVEYYEQIIDFIGSDKFIIFGSGKYGKHVSAIMHICLGHSNFVFWDNAVNRQGKKLNGHDIYAPSATSNSKIIIAVAVKNRDIIKKQILDMGIKEENVFVYDYPEMDGRLLRAHNLFRRKA